MYKLNFIFIVIITFISILFSSCVRKSKYVELQTQKAIIDSTYNENREQLEMILAYIDTIASSIDSITHQEVLLLSRTNSDGVKFSKKQIEENLDLLESLINRQRNKIYRLDSTIVVLRDSTFRLRSVISYLYDELDKKDAEIAEMRSEIGKKNKKIRMLSAKVSNLESDMTTLTYKAQEQTELISAQDQLIAEQDSLLFTGYYVIGKKKELKQMGILSGNLFSGNKVDISNIDLSIFTKVDIRTFSRLEITGVKSKIISPMASDSYEYIVEDNNHTLIIKDFQQFWKASKILIIQL